MRRLSGDAGLSPAIADNDPYGAATGGDNGDPASSGRYFRH
ncbi:hypothetical protein [Brevundimonas sp.]